MDRNLILAVALSMLVFTAWAALQSSMAPPPEEIVAEQVAEQVDGSETVDVVEESTSAPAPSGAAAAAATDTGTAAVAESENLIEETPETPLWERPFDSDLVTARLTNRGGTFDRWSLVDYKQHAGGSEPVELLAQSAPYDVILATPFRDLGFSGDGSERYRVVENTPDQVTFELVREGVRVRKTIARAANDYGFRLDLSVKNLRTGDTIQPRFELEWPAVIGPKGEAAEVSLLALDVDGVSRDPVASLGGGGFFKSLFGGGDDGPPTFTDDVRWAGTDLKYFAGLVVPPEDAAAEVVFELREKGKAGVMVMRLEPTRIDPGDEATRSFFVFLGPKQPKLLEGLGHQLDESINRGYTWVSPLAAFFERALHIMYRFIPNYGVVIILLTVVVRLATWPIMAKQMKSSEKMRELMPRLKELQEKYKDDRQKQSEMTFALYREAGVNPLAGCFPLLLQMPVFIGLFYALQSSIDLRQAPFMLWINDLSQPATLFYLPGLDFPFRLLPLLMGVSMFAQQKMTPQTGMDPAQQKMMLMMMPGMMLFISYGFPSGLVLYWTVSNLIGIGHQLMIRRKMQSGE